MSLHQKIWRAIVQKGNVREQLLQYNPLFVVILYYREPVNRAISDSPTFTDTHTEYRLAGLDALEMLHNQLQILVSLIVHCFILVTHPFAL